MSWRYWKVVCRYGHVGIGKEVSVARYLVTDKAINCIGVLDIAQGMPGVKAKGVISVFPISQEDWEVGKRMEEENFFLIQLFGGRGDQAAS